MKVEYYIYPGTSAKITFIAENKVEIEPITLATVGYERGGEK